jgi:hypothetical protein
MPRPLSYSLLAQGPDGPELRALDGQWVCLSGHVLSTSADAEMKKFLLAKNPWDGCCLGTPPTALDSVYVQMRGCLSNPAAKTARVSGVFVIAPKKINDELAELYFLKNAVEGETPSTPEPGAPFPWVGSLVGAALVLGCLSLLRRRKT